MLILSGYRLNENDSISIALKKILGIGSNKADQILYILGYTSIKSFLKKLTYLQKLKLDKIIVHYVHGFRVKRNKQHNIGILQEIRSYKGIRHSCNLPVRGQRTHTNAQSQRKKT